MLKKRILLITGGTGSFGNAVLNRYVDSNEFNEIRIFSRDEKKQDEILAYTLSCLKKYPGIKNAWTYEELEKTTFQQSDLENYYKKIDTILIPYIYKRFGDEK